MFLSIYRSFLTHFEYIPSEELLLSRFVMVSPMVNVICHPSLFIFLFPFRFTDLCELTQYDWVR